MSMNWVKRGLVSGLIVGSVVLIVGCAKQETPAPAPGPDVNVTVTTDSTTVTSTSTETVAPAAPVAEDTTKK